ncbi:WHG domain-containing protein [Streptomyces sp. NPDC050658]|uniref:TetR-like C-terminal domain-containing protein n=1 Tax=unclassified Streptomyces TaxID=2593676 RepID=UPI003419F51E
MTSTEGQHEADALVERLKPAALERLAERAKVDLEPGVVARAAGVDVEDVRRHFPDQEALLSALVMGGYNAIGASAEVAGEAAVAADLDPMGRWAAVWQGAREWAVTHPEEYVLLWGRPVPGYVAPEESVVAAARLVLVMAAILRDAQKAGELTGDRPGEGPLSEGMQQNADSLSSGLLAGLPDSVIARMFVVWTQLHGLLTLEVNNHLAAVAVAPTSVFEYATEAMGEYIGLSRKAAG